MPLDQDVYDAAEWSCITELSERSVRQGSVPVEIPDFTRGTGKRDSAVSSLAQGDKPNGSHLKMKRTLIF